MASVGRDTEIRGWFDALLVFGNVLARQGEDRRREPIPVLALRGLIAAWCATVPAIGRRAVQSIPGPGRVERRSVADVSQGRHLVRRGAKKLIAAPDARNESAFEVSRTVIHSTLTAEVSEPTLMKSELQFGDPSAPVVCMKTPDSSLLQVLAEDFNCK
jgi:hypothetical protein